MAAGQQGLLTAHAAAAGQGLLVVVFLASAGSKLRGRQALRAFAASLVPLGLVRTGLALPVAAAVAAAEAAAVVLLAVPLTRTAGFAVAATLLVVLTAGVALVLARGTAAPCRCFGPSATPLSTRHLVRNLGLTGTAVLGLAASSSGPPPAAGLLAVLGGAVVGLLVAVLDDVVALFTPLPAKES